MSPNHYYGFDDNGTLAIYYNGDSPLFTFDDDYLIDELSEWPLTAHVREFIYDHIQENGDHSLLYSFDGGMENGIDEARGYISSAIEAYIELENDNKTLLHKTTLKKLMLEQTKFIEKENSANLLFEKFNTFILNESELRKYDNEVVDDFKNKLVETFQKYKNKAANLKQDIRDEKEWSLPNGSYDDKDSGEECDEEYEEEEEVDDEDN